MSRVGSKTIEVPDKVKVAIADNHVSVEGPKGKLEMDMPSRTTVSQDENVLSVARDGDDREAKAMHGLGRSLLNNMVVGVSEGFSKELQIIGVGYRAAPKGSDLELQLGFSHPVIVKAPDGIEFDVPEPTRIIVSGTNKQVVGQVAADIRSHRKPEPYKGKGVRYLGEHVARKAGKAAK